MGFSLGKITFDFGRNTLKADFVYSKISPSSPPFLSFYYFFKSKRAL